MFQLAFLWVIQWAAKVANPRSARCTPCDIGTVPKLSRRSCIKCTGQQYALQGDEECKKCTFPAMILGIDNWCTSLHSVLFLVSFLILALIVAAVFGRFRLCCFKRRLRAMVDAKKWRELHMTQASGLEYGVWFPAAVAALEKQKEEVNMRSFELGISLHFVFTELEATALKRISGRRTADVAGELREHHLAEAAKAGR